MTQDPDGRILDSDSFFIFATESGGHGLHVGVGRPPAPQVFGTDVLKRI